MSYLTSFASSGMKHGSRNVTAVADEVSSLDLRLMIANRIVERSWREHKTDWTRQDVGMLLLEALPKLCRNLQSRQSLLALKRMLVHAYLGACDAIPEEHRDF